MILEKEKEQTLSGISAVVPLTPSTSQPGIRTEVTHTLLQIQLASGTLLGTSSSVSYLFLFVCLFLVSTSAHILEQQTKLGN